MKDIRRLLEQRKSFGLDDLRGDTHASRYGDVIKAHSKEVAVLLSFLGEPATQGRMLDAALLYGVPPLVPLVPLMPEKLVPLLDELRTRQLVGVAVRILMTKLGFETTGKKGAVAAPFTRAEIYQVKDAGR